MNKETLLQKSRGLGLDIVKLINEYRTSCGENVDHNEDYFADFFSGIIAFMCVGSGTVELEYDADPKYNIIDAIITNNADAEYSVSPKYIDSKLATTEVIEIIDGKPVKSYNQTMDPITFIELLARTGLGGAPLIKEKEVVKRAI